MSTKQAKGDGPRIVTQFTRFIIVGGINTAVDLAVLNALIYWTDSGREGLLFTVFKTIAFSVAVVNSYLLNKFWTFEATQKKVAGTLTPFLIVSLVGLVLNVGTAYLFATHVPYPVEAMKPLWPSIASLAGTGAGLVWNFIGYRTVVFNKPTAAAEASSELEGAEAAGAAAPEPLT